MEEQRQILTIDTAAGLEPKKLEPLPIYTDSLPALKIQSLPFNFDAPQLNAEEFALQLMMTMKMYNGLGLAAVQCNVPLRIFALACDIVCFNPTILAVTEEVERDKEGCLSFPGIYIPVTRNKGVKLEWYDHKGVRFEQEFTGLTARTILHEYDHLEGIVFTKYVGSLTMQMAKKRRKKLLKRYERAKNNRPLSDKLRINT
jgi:peptide deformylase